LATAVKIADIPQQIRGFGHVKDASLKPARVEEALLWKAWDKLPAKEAVPA
jgi:indolepyruvate ferredoxin oxidoreductase